MKMLVPCAAIVVCAFATGYVHARALTFEDRVAAQKAIEQVYWNHRVWPSENPSPKRALSAVMSDEAIGSKVVDYLRKSSALNTWWQRPITAEQLQAELDRMAKGSRDPEVLQELFSALGNDPYVIAETLARQTLADRLVRNWYSNDTRFHADTRAKAEAALASCPTLGCMRSMGGDYRERTLKTRQTADVVDGYGIGFNRVQHLDPEQWKQDLDRLAAKFGVARDSLPVGRLSPLEETAESFSVIAIVSTKQDEVLTASVEWPKRTFDSWWAADRTSESMALATSQASLALPAITSTGCTNDTWTPTFVVPHLNAHSAIWTGTEMIIWGAGRYNPSTDSWTGYARGVNTPETLGTSVWSGTELIVWGGLGVSGDVNTGARYNPMTDTWIRTSTGANVPSPREQHTLVWTGTEMIVWGGYTPAPSPGHMVNTGGRYDPATDSWAPVSIGANVPSAREYHTAVWTGTDMIIWGGTPNGITYVNTGARYNPSTDAWTATSIGANVPSSRGLHTALWTGTEMIIWGGNGYLRTGGRYNPSSDSWLATSTGTGVPQGRRYHAVVWTGTEMIVWGGEIQGPGYSNTGGKYSPGTDSWSVTSTAANVPSARERHSAVWTGREMIVFGGAGANGDLNTGGRYDAATDSWTATSATGNVPTLRRFHSAVWTGAEMIVWGGLSYNGTTDIPVNTGGRYTPATDSWTTTSIVGNVPSARSSQAAVWTGKEMIVWGGPDNSGGRYKPTTDSWLPTSLGANVPAGRSDHTAVWTGTQMIVWGGNGAGGYLNDGGKYDPNADMWTATSTGANVPTGRSHHKAVWTGTEMIVWGGYYVDTDLHRLNSGGRYKPSLDSWSVTSTGANVPSARDGHTAVWTGTEMIVWGGYTPAGYLNTGGRYNPSSDSWSATSTGANVPSERNYHSAVWTGAEMIVFGGYGTTTYLNTGGRYSPNTDGWLATSTAAGVPVERFDHTAVWTGTEMIVWGGSTPSGSANASGTGGRYCACPGGGLVYRDVDGDGYGDPSVSFPSCDGSVPVGYAADGTDCNDADPSVYPNAPEINDGIDNQCAGDPGYGLIDEISGTSGFMSPSDKTKFGWVAQGAASSYDVVRSTTADFSSGCTLFSTSQPFIVDPAVPAGGIKFYYLVRPAAPHVGSWGQNSDGTLRGVSCIAAANLAQRD